MPGEITNALNNMVAERERYARALRRAHEQLLLVGVKGPKQVGRALNTIERALDIEPEDTRAS